MKKTRKENRRTGRPARMVFCVGVFLFHLAVLFSGKACAELAEELAKCAAMKNEDRRLKCYDSLAERQDQAKMEETAETTPSPAEPGCPDTPIVSMLEKLYELPKEDRTDSPMVQWHHPNYFLFAAYNDTPNTYSSLDVDPRARVQNTEAVFQLSGKVRLLPEKLLGDHLDFWVGYTQRSFWQLYNSPFSSPFRDTNYEPEGFLTYSTKREINLFGRPLLDLRVINAGLVHQSNGRARPLSRSWNRVYAEFGFERVWNRKPKEGRNEFNLFIKPWYRIPEEGADDDNPDILRFMGYGEVRGVYYWKYYRFGVMLRNNLRGSDNRGAVQLDAAVPFEWVISTIPFARTPIEKLIQNDRASVYLQYFNGYGESLLDYNSSSNRISAGLMITNWDWE